MDPFHVDNAAAVAAADDDDDVAAAVDAEIKWKIGWKIYVFNQKDRVHSSRRLPQIESTRRGIRIIEIGD